MTRIAAITTHPVVVPLRKPRRTAHEPLAQSALLLVEVRTEDGLTGYGQVTSTPLKEIAAWTERLAEAAVGLDARAPIAVREKLFALPSPQPDEGALPRGPRPQILAAIGGIDMALWDVLGKAAGLPVFRLLGAENRPVFTYATGGYYVDGAPLDACAEELAGFVRQGYRAVKLKTGAGQMRDEIARVRATREAIGPDIALMLDMNAAYDLPECIAFARAVAPYDITWLEEPLHWYLQPVDFVRLAAASPIALAHGEREIHRFTTRDFIASGAIRYVQFDATRYAGFTEALRVAHLAEQHGVLISPHHAPELHCHLLAAFPRMGYAVESHGAPAERDPAWAGLYRERAQIRDGYVHMSEKPGFGIEIDWDFVRRHRG